jgi:hypothetical protein
VVVVQINTESKILEIITTLVSARIAAWEYQIIIVLVARCARPQLAVILVYKSHDCKKQKDMIEDCAKISHVGAKADPRQQRRRSRDASL